MQDLIWTRKPTEATEINAHQVYEAIATQRTVFRIIKFGDHTQYEEKYPYTLAVSLPAGGWWDKQRSQFVNVSSPARYGAHMLLDSSVRDDGAYMQAFDKNMYEVDYSFATLKEAKAAVQSIKFLFFHTPDTKGGFISEPRRY